MTASLTNPNEGSLAENQANPWPERAERAAFLAEKYPFAAQMLGFYRKLAPIQAHTWEKTRQDRPEPPAIAAWALENGRPAPLSEVARREGPALLAQSLAALADAPEVYPDLLQAYLADIPMPQVAGCSPDAAFFLARATLGPVLEAVDLESAVSSPLTGEERRCPWCWGLPQCKTLAEASEYSSACHLVCARCSRAWKYPRRRCASCGEERLAKLAIFEATDTLPHLRVDACRSCQHYLVTVDYRKDGRAVDLVDELCALPLELWTQEQGFTKIHPNLLGV